MDNVVSLKNRISQKELKGKILAILNSLNQIERGRISPKCSEAQQMLKVAKKTIADLCKLAGFETLTEFAPKMKKEDRERLYDCFLLDREKTAVDARREEKEIEKKEKAAEGRRILENLKKGITNVPILAPVVTPCFEYRVSARLLRRVQILGKLKLGEFEYILIDECDVKKTLVDEYFSNSSIGVLPPNCFVLGKDGRAYVRIGGPGKMAIYPIERFYLDDVTVGLETFVEAVDIF